MTVQKVETPDAAATATEGNKETQRDHPNTKQRTRQQRWRQRNPRSYLAHITVANALRLGVLERQPCAVCGDPKAEAHHNDYANPLEVSWLCRTHHRARHALDKGRA